jgi:hypothetical protein
VGVDTQLRRVRALRDRLGDDDDVRLTAEESAALCRAEERLEAAEQALGQRGCISQVSTLQMLLPLPEGRPSASDKVDVCPGIVH